MLRSEPLWESRLNFCHHFQWPATQLWDARLKSWVPWWLDPLMVKPIPWMVKSPLWITNNHHFWWLNPISDGFQLLAQAIFKSPSGSATEVILFAFAAMSQQVQPAPCESSPNTKKMKEKAAQIRKSFQRPKFWVMGFGWCLAACAGAANVIAFKSWNLYASHVTGSTSAIAFRLEGYHQGEYVSGSLKEACLLVFSFLCGAYACGLLIDKNQVHFGGKAFYGLALVLNSSLLVSAAFIPGRLLPACLVAAACGLQNAMCTSHFGAIIRTTHVTGTMTDIGSTFGRISMIYFRKGCRRSKLNDVERAEVGVDARKLAVLFGLWSFYFMGGLFGVYMENIIPGPLNVPCCSQLPSLEVLVSSTWHAARFWRTTSRSWSVKGSKQTWRRHMMSWRTWGLGCKTWSAMMSRWWNWMRTWGTWSRHSMRWRPTLRTWCEHTAGCWSERIAPPANLTSRDCSVLCPGTVCSVAAYSTFDFKLSSAGQMMARIACSSEHL